MPQKFQCVVGSLSWIYSEINPEHRQRLEQACIPERPDIYRIESRRFDEFAGHCLGRRIIFALDAVSTLGPRTVRSRNSRPRLY
jgi:hypothetical protein